MIFLYIYIVYMYLLNYSSQFSVPIVVIFKSPKGKAIFLVCLSVSQSSRFVFQTFYASHWQISFFICQLALSCRITHISNQVNFYVTALKLRKTSKCKYLFFGHFFHQVLVKKIQITADPPS